MRICPGNKNGNYNEGPRQTENNHKSNCITVLQSITSFSLNPPCSKHIFKDSGKDTQTNTDFPQRVPVKGRSYGTEDHRSPPRGLMCKEEVATDRWTDIRRSALASLRLGPCVPFLPMEVPGEGNGVEHTDGKTQSTKQGSSPETVIPRRPGLCPHEASVLVKKPDLQVTAQATGDV